MSAPTTDENGNAPSWEALSDQPTELVRGLRAWRNPNNGFTVALLHFTADPDGASEEARRAGMSPEQFAREHDLSFDSWAGKPVFPSFTDKHVAEVFPAEGVPVVRSWDFGYHRPAVTFHQFHGEWWQMGEVMGEDMTLDQFVNRVVLPYQEKLFPEGTTFIDTADPAGRQMTDKSEHTSFAILANYGIFPRARRSEVNEGLTIIRQHLTDVTYKVHPRCRITIEGFKGGYRYPEPTAGTPEPLFPLKDGYFDHVFDTIRYAAVNNLTVRLPRHKPVKKEPSFVDRVLASRQHTDEDLGDFY